MISNELEKLKQWIQRNTIRSDDPRYSSLVQGPNPRAVVKNGLLHHPEGGSFRAGLPMHPGSALAKNSWEQNYDLNLKEIRELREILGSIMKSVNTASLIFKQASRSPNEQTAILAKQSIDEIIHYPEIKRFVAQIKSMFEAGGGYSDQKTRNAILHIVHYLEQVNFTQGQIEKLKQVISNFNTNNNDFPEEINQEGLDNLLRNSIYNLSSGSSKTLKVIREVLQNAVDATDPKQHPDLEKREEFNPEIHLATHSFGNYIDLIIEDKGIGMDWETLSKKFFVTFDSGKKTDAGAAGGFGIAKALIQDSPEHGWSIDTNGIHSSRFHKNVYMGSRKEDSYQTPTSEIKKTSNGTILSLHGLPWAYDEDIKKLCSVYAINGRVKIFFEEKEIEPKFLMNSPEIKSLDSLEELPNLITSKDSEKEAAEEIFEKHKDDLKEKMEEVGLVSENGKTKYRFYLKKTEFTSGRLYVMVNGQYQFDKDKLIPKIDLICSIETTARPGSEEYPLDPGREYLRGDINAKIDSLISAIKKYTEALSRNQLFKDGIESIVVNEEAEPMTVEDSESTATKKDKMMHVLTGLTGSSGFAGDKQNDEERKEPEEPGQDSEKPSQEPTTQEPGQEPNQEPRTPTPEDLFTKDVEEKKRIAEVAEELERQAGPHSVFDRDAIVELVKDAFGTKNRIEQNQKLKAIVEGLTTPGHVLIQKDFLARKIISENTGLVADILILWQKILRLLVKKLGSVSRYSDSVGKAFIPGVIFSDEVLGLWMGANPEAGRKYDSISINPVTLAAAINPKYFKEKISNEGEELSFMDTVLEEKEQSEETKGSRDADTPINRTAKFIYHLAIHEICHLIYPDYGGQSDNFHKNITKLELVCHDAFEEIRREVRLHMPRLKKSSKKLIALVHKSKPTPTTEGFSHWENIRSKFIKVNTEFKLENKLIKPKSLSSFKEFLIEFDN